MEVSREMPRTEYILQKGMHKIRIYWLEFIIIGNEETRNREREKSD